METIQSTETRQASFQGVKVLKKWGFELECFNNSIVSCWYLKINRDQQTSLHMHQNKETSLILLNGSALLQEGLSSSRTATALDKTRFSEKFFHKTTAVNGDCELLEIERPIDKLDLYRFKDSYGRAGQPYEQSFVPLGADDPQFVGGRMTLGDTTLRVLEFINAQAFVAWTRRIPANSIVISARGSLRSRHGVEIVVPGHSNWAKNLPDLLADTTPDDNMQVIFIHRESATI